MKKILTLLLVSLVWIFQASAEQISEQEAYQVAQQFFATGKKLVKGAPPSTTPLQLAHTATSYYAFNRGETAGFVIIAADDNFSNKVLGYSDKGNFDIENMPENVRWWLSEYDRALRAAQEVGIDQSAQGINIRKAAQTERTNIAPLVSSQWNQDSPYNDMCPTYNGTRCPTGCLATAVAQIVYYNRYPEQGVGTHSYDWTVNGVSQGTLSVNFAQSTYDYDSMSDTYNSSSSQASRNAVAKLMYDVGVASNMGYGPNASGAISIDAAAGLVRNFNYDKGAIVLSRDFYTDEEWIDMLYSSLSESTPLYYAGANESAGHAFVCDGYRDGYFHINWGWGGYYNGYFLIDALDPEGQGIGGSDAGYNQGQEAIFNLKRPQAGSKYIKLMYNYNDFDIDTKSQTTSSRNVRFKGAFYNFSLITQTINLGLKVVDSNGNVTWINDLYPEPIDPYSGVAEIIVNLSGFPSAEGEYTVYPAYQDENDTWQEMRTVNTSQKQYLTATVSGTNITFANPGETTQELEFANWRSTEVIAGQEFSIQVDITNNTGSTFTDNIRLVLLEYGTTNAIESSAEQLLNLTNNNSATVTFTMTAPETAGYYDFVVINSEWYTICDIMTLQVIENSNTNNELSLTLNSLSVENSENVSLDNINITAQVTCESGTYDNGFFAFAVFPETGGNSIDFKYQDFSIATGETKSLNYTGTFSGLEADKTYFTAVFYYLNNSWNQVGTGVFFHTAAQSGIDEISNDNIPTETSVYNLSGVRLLHFEAGVPLDTTSLEPGIYIVKSGNTTKRILINKD